MPDLDDTIHLDMLRAGRGEHPSQELYGLHWGDPATAPHLQFFAKKYIAPYLDPTVDAVEIGPGGGRWTQMLMGFRRLYAVDYHQELLDELARGIRSPRVTPVLNDGTTLPGIPDQSIEYVFSFGVFVHLERPIRDAYLREIRRVLSPTGVAVIQYGEKRKRRAAKNRGFAHNTAPEMRESIIDADLFIREENLTLLGHSNVVCFQRNELNYEQTPPGSLKRPGKGRVGRARKGTLTHQALTRPASSVDRD